MPDLEDTYRRRNQDIAIEQARGPIRSTVTATFHNGITGEAFATLDLPGTLPTAVWVYDSLCVRAATDSPDGNPRYVETTPYRVPLTQLWEQAPLHPKEPAQS